MRNKVVKTVVAGMLAGCFGLFGCSSGDEGDTGAPDSGQKPEAQQAQQAPSQESSQAAAEYGITIDEGIVGADYEGKPTLVVTYSFTNNSDKATSFMVAISAKAFQNGVELESAISTDVDTQSSMSEIKPGATTAIQWSYLLDDESEVTVECTELISLDDTVLAEKTFAVA